jgi:toxin ParE1/3/4
MAEYVLSEQAADDLTEIYLFSYQQFGESKADAYLLGLEERFELLAETPLIGRKIDHIRAGYLRYAHASHSIFYTSREEGILVIRVLHRSMDAETHL